MTMQNRLQRRQRGITLIEVLVALLIFSVGLIGLAGLLVFATQANHSAYMRTQATFLANNMAHRMGANSAGVWGDDYNATDYPVSGTLPNCTAGCTPAQVAARDKVLWSQMLRSFLPGVQAAIQCKDAKLKHPPTPKEIAMRPPFGGRCTMQITWNERGVGDKDHRDATPQTFTWVFQP